jgi:hypothetical protein
MLEHEKKAADAARRIGYLKSLLMVNSPTLQRKFSSTPLDPETVAAVEASSSSSNTNTSRGRGADLSQSERTYLESLLQEGDANLIERASQRLCDPLLFPPLDQCHFNAMAASRDNAAPVAPEEDSAEEADEERQRHEQKQPPKRTLSRRDSQLQQELFRLHETTAIPPSRMLQRMNDAHRNSILDDDTDTADSVDAVLSEGLKTAAEATAAAPMRSGAGSAVGEFKFDGNNEDYDDDINDLAVIQNAINNKDIVADRETSPSSSLMESWNPFKDVASWLDGSQGVEVGDNGVPCLPKQKDPNTSRVLQQQPPFRILGTAADDVSCHPHVLSPPLMESLLAFVPESLSLHNFLLKYSLVRDGPNLFTMLRQARASDCTFLAIETVDGHVFGSYTSQAWRLAQGWYGNKESFLWRMRHSRLETTTSIVEQANQESEIQVFPYRAGNVAVQYCSKDCLMLGQGELLPNTTRGGQHYGRGLYLDVSLFHGSTSTSETFGNPCLVNADARGAVFDVSNVEVWTLTPHVTVAEAEQSEMATFFLDGARDGTDSLNIMSILVGGPI